MRTLTLTEAYPIEKLRPHPENYRRHDLDAIAAALTDHGQHRTIGVRADDPERPLEGAQILAGHGVFYATRDRLGGLVIAATVVECDDDEAREIVVKDNRWGALGVKDPGKELALLESIAGRGRLAAVGYDQDDYEDLLAKAGAVKVAPVEPFAGGYAETPEDEAARAAAAEPGEEQGGGVLKQVVLVFRTAAEHGEFQRQVTQLQRRYGVTGGVTAVALEALRREIEAPPPR